MGRHIFLLITNNVIRDKYPVRKERKNILFRTRKLEVWYHGHDSSNVYQKINRSSSVRDRGGEFQTQKAA
jgi:hypothetical protein